MSSFQSAGPAAASTPRLLPPPVFSPSEETFDGWYARIPRADPSDAMIKNWMFQFEIPCTAACCRAQMCGSIQCDLCRVHVVSDRYINKMFVCMECQLAYDEEPPGGGAFVALTRFCEKCFNRGDVAHPHVHFCEIDEKGHHSKIIRPVPPQELFTLSREDFKALPNITYSGEELCGACWSEELSDSNPAVAAPFCQHGHSAGDTPPSLSTHTVSGSKFCRECAYITLTYKLGGEGDQLPKYAHPEFLCLCCAYDRDKANWIIEFSNQCRSVASGELCDNNPDVLIERLHAKFDELQNLHEQRWIRNILLEGFTAFAETSNVQTTFKLTM